MITIYKNNHYSIKQLLLSRVRGERGREIEAMNLPDVLQGYNGKSNRIKMFSLFVT